MRQIELKQNAWKNVVIGALCLLVLGLLVVLCMQNGSLFAVQEEDGLLRIDDSAVPYGGPDLLDRNPGQTGIKIPGYASITIPAGVTDVNVSLLNPEDNPCYFTFELVLDDTGESLYTSDMVEPSMCLEQISLSEPLSAGEYGATIKIRTYSLSSLEAMNNANVKTVLKVV